MNVRMSDVVALGAIAAGALVPVTLALASLRATPEAPTLQIGMDIVEVTVEPTPETAVPPAVEHRATSEECLVEELVDLREQRRFLEEQIALHEAEVLSLQDAVDGIRERVRSEIALARTELETDPALDPTSRREMVAALESDLTHMIEAEIVAERAMADVALSLQRQLAMLEIQVATRSLEGDADDGKRKRRRRPCR